MTQIPIFSLVRIRGIIYFNGATMTGKKLTVVVHELIGEDAAISTEDGNSLYERVEKAIDKGANVAISFKNIHLMTTAFLNAAIGQLYGKYSSEILNKQLEILDLGDTDKEVLRNVIRVAKEYFKNKEQVGKRIDEELSDDN